MSFIKFLISALILAAIQSPVYAEEPSATEKEVQELLDGAADAETPFWAEPVKPEVHEGFVDKVQEEISNRVLSSAEWLDSFFLDKRTIREENQSYVQLRYDAFTETGIEQTEFTPSFGMQLRLPELERIGRKISLVFESEPAAPVDGVPGAVSRSGAQVLPSQTRTTSAALHFLMTKTAQQSFLVRTGALLNIDQTLFFISPRYRAFIPLKIWNFRFTQDVIYRTGTAFQPKTEWETETNFDLERKLPYDLFFRSYLNAIWLREADDYIYNIGGTLIEPLDSNRALSYGWNNRFIAQPADLILDEVRFSVQYRQSFWRKWLFYEVVPHYRFPRERDFDATAGILFRIEAYFGYVE